MCCTGFSTKIVPFFITFTLGLVATGIFYGVFGSSSETFRIEREDRIYKHRKTSCGFEKRTESEKKNVYEIVPEVPVAPLPPPAPRVAPMDFDAPEEFETTLLPPTPPETIIVWEEIEKKNK